MGCPHPVGITRDLDTFRADNPDRPRMGDPGVFFHPKTGKFRVEMSVPCGKCETCYSARATQWAIRCYCESLEHDKVSFLTLTYDDEHLPKDGKIHKEELQKFFKRLRKKIPHVRYFACGEYGDLTRRPHYHAIIFGADFLGDATRFNADHYTSETLTEVWGLGLATTTPATFSTICYTVGYVAKKIGDPDCFQLMSRRPGLGSAYIQKYEADLRASNSITIEGRDYPIPEYFFTQEDFDDIKKHRKTLSKPLSYQKRNSRAIIATEKTKRKRGKI